MQLQLNIKDEDLNKEIKRLADAHLKSIVRSEIAKVIGEEVKVKMKAFDKDKMNELVNKEVKTQIKAAVNPSYYNSPVKKEIKSQIETMVTEALLNHMGDVEKIIAQSVKDRMDKVLRG